MISEPTLSSGTQVIEFVSELSDQTDRGVAIVAGAVSEDQLERVIHKLIAISTARFVRRLFGRSMFAARLISGLLSVSMTTNCIRDADPEYRDIRNDMSKAHTGCERVITSYSSWTSSVARSSRSFRSSTLGSAKLKNLPDGAAPSQGHVFMHRLCRDHELALLGGKIRHQTRAGRRRAARRRRTPIASFGG